MADRDDHGAAFGQPCRLDHDLHPRPPLHVAAAIRTRIARRANLHNPCAASSRLVNVAPAAWTLAGPVTRTTCVARHEADRERTRADEPERSAPEVDRGGGDWPRLAAVRRWPRRQRSSPIPTRPGEAPSVLTADTVTNNSATGVMTATGDVEISTGRRRLLADEVRYDRRTDKMFAKGNVVLIEPSGDAMFGDEVEVTGRPPGGLRPGGRHAARGRFADRRQQCDAPRRQRRSSSTARSTRPAPSATEGKGGPLVADQGAAGRARRERPRR